MDILERAFTLELKIFEEKGSYFMKLTHENVQRVAKLARIRMDDDRIETSKDELNAIFSWIEKLQDVDVSSVALEDLIPHEAMTERDDVVTDGGIPEDIVKNAPDHAHMMFSVPKMVE